MNVSVRVNVAVSVVVDVGVHVSVITISPTRFEFPRFQSAMFCTPVGVADGGGIGVSVIVYVSVGIGVSVREYVGVGVLEGVADIVGVFVGEPFDTVNAIHAWFPMLRLGFA